MRTSILVMLICLTLPTFANMGFNNTNSINKEGEFSGFRSTPSQIITVIGIGTDNYQSPELRTLNHSVNDVEDFIDLIEQQHSNGWYEDIYGAVETHVFTGEQANLDEIITLFKSLENSEENRKIIIYISGHGLVQNDNFYIPLYNTSLEELAATAIDGRYLQDLMFFSPADILLMLDTSHADPITRQKLHKIDISSSSPVFDLFSFGGGSHAILSATSGDNVAYELPNRRNGVFATALLEAFTGADVFEPPIYNRLGELSLYSLLYYISDRVERLTQSRQIPTANTTANNYTISVVKNLAINQNRRITLPTVIIETPKSNQNISQSVLELKFSVGDNGESPNYVVRIGQEELQFSIGKVIQSEAESKNYILKVQLPDKYRGETVILHIDVTNSVGTTTKSISFNYLALAETEPPSLVLLSPSLTNISELTGTSFNVTLRVKTNSLQKLRYEIFHENDLLSTNVLNKGVGAEQEVDGTQSVTLPISLEKRLVDGQETYFTIIAINENDQDSDPVQFTMVYNDNYKSDERRLIVIGIGTEEYQSSDFTTLRYSVDDVEDFVALIEEQYNKGWYEGLYDKFEPHLLTNEEATLEEVITILAEYEKDVTNKDTILILISGHGLNEGGRYFIPLHATNPDKLAATAIDGDDLQDLMERSPARIIMMLDTCHAGAAADVDEDNYGSLSSPDEFLAQSGDIIRQRGNNKGHKLILAASTGNTVAFEPEGLENGAFTEALLEGLQGGNVNDPTQTADGEINILSLMSFVSQRVKELTGGRQITAHKTEGTDFVITTLKE